MSYRDALDQRLAAPGGLPSIPYLELGSAALLCQMVEQGMGLSFLPGVHRRARHWPKASGAAERAGLHREDAPAAVLPPGQWLTRR